MSIFSREIQKKDVPLVTQIHLTAFPGFFLTILGRGFLKELYLAIIQDPSGMIFGCELGGQLVGFVAGTSQPAGFYRRLLRRRWWRFVLPSLAAVLKDPLILPRLLRAFRKPQDVSDQADTATLMSIAVDPEVQGRGVGYALVKTFLVEAARLGLKRVDLTTDGINNDSVNQFYQSMGFKVLRTFVTPEGREMNEYVIDV